MEYYRRQSKTDVDHARSSNPYYPQGIPDTLPPMAPIAQLSTPVPSSAWNTTNDSRYQAQVTATTQQLDNSLVKAMEEEKIALKAEYQKERAKLQECPESHPQYGAEWEQFWAKRSREVKASGKDPQSYDYVPEWKKFWDKRGEELLLALFTSKLDALQLRYSRQSLPAIQRSQPVDSVNNPTATSVQDTPNVATILDGLRRSEDYLEPLMTQVLQFLRLAGDMELSIPGGSNMLLNSRDLLQLLADCKDRFLTKMQTELISPDVLIVLNRNVYSISKILQLSSTFGQAPSSGISSSSSIHSHGHQHKTDNMQVITQSQRDSQLLNMNMNEFNRRQPTTSNNPYGGRPVESVESIPRFSSPHDNSSWEFARRPDNRRLDTVKPPMAASSDQEWMDFFTRSEQDSTTTRGRTEIAATEFLANASTEKSSKSYLRVEPLKRASQTDLSLVSALDDGPSKEKSELQGPPIKKSCLRPSKPTPRSDSPEIVQVVNPATTAESWRRVIVGSNSRPNRNQPSAPERVSRNSQEIRRKNPPPPVVPPPKPIVLSHSRNYDKTRRAREFGSESEDSDLSDQGHLDAKFMNNFVKTSSSHSGTSEENPGASSAISLLKARGWYQQYLDVEEEKSAKKEPIASTSISNSIPVVSSTVSAEMSLPSSSATSSSPPPPEAGSDNVAADQSRPSGETISLMKKWRLVRDGQLELEPEEVEELKVKVKSRKRAMRVNRKINQKARRLEELKAGIIKPATAPGKLSKRQQKNRSNARKRLREKELRGDEVEPEPIIEPPPSCDADSNKGEMIKITESRFGFESLDSDLSTHGPLDAKLMVNLINSSSDPCSLLKARGWYQQYLHVEEGKNAKKEPIASTSTSSLIPMILSTVSTESSFPSTSSSDLPTAGSEHVALDESLPAEEKRFLMNKLKRAQDGYIELEPEELEKLKVLKVKFDSMKRLRRKLNQKARRQEELRAGIIKPSAPGKLSKRQQKNRRNARKRLREKELQGGEIEPEPFIQPPSGEGDSFERETIVKAKLNQLINTTEDIEEPERVGDSVPKSENNPLILLPVLKIEDGVVGASDFSLLSCDRAEELVDIKAEPNS